MARLHFYRQLVQQTLAIAELQVYITVDRFDIAWLRSSLPLAQSQLHRLPSCRWGPLNDFGPVVAPSSLSVTYSGVTAVAMLKSVSLTFLSSGLFRTAAVRGGVGWGRGKMSPRRAAPN